MPVEQTEQGDLFTEYSEPREAENYDRLSELIIDRMKELYDSSDRAYRDTHAKSHAAVKASIEIFDIDEAEMKRKLTEIGIPELRIKEMSIRQGLFARPAIYPVWLRFANGNGSRNPDKAPDTRSMSVKIIGVEGERLLESYVTSNQDIITQNCDIFFVKSIKYYNSFLKSVFTSKLSLLKWMLLHPGQALALIRITRFHPQSLLTERYWSGSAFSLGESGDSEACPAIDSVRYPAAVKFAFTPVSPEAPYEELPRIPLNLPKKTLADNYYRDELIERLKKPDAKFCWNLGLQFQANADMSIDDITVSWPEQQSPFLTVGRMTVEHQVIDFEKQLDFCESLTFSPWNGLKAHRPVGALNRLRRLVYPLVATYRHRKYAKAYREPTSLELNE